MVDVGFGAYGSGTRFTPDSPVRNEGIGLPAGRACSDGANRAGIVALYGYAGGGVTMQLQLGSAITGAFGASGAASAQFTGWVGTNLWVVSGGSATYYMHFSGGSIRFGGGGGGTTYDSTNFSWAGTMPGGYRYIQPPLAPSISVVSNSDGDQATVTLTGPADTGESALTGHRFQRANNAAFTSGLTTTNYVGPTVVTGLTPGNTYYYRAVARNALTDAAGVLGGAWSGTLSVTQADPNGLGRRFNGTSFVASDGKRFNGTTWQEIEGRRYNSSTGTWQPLGY